MAESLIEQARAYFDILVKSRFNELFGDLESNPYQWPVKTIGDLATDVKYGTSKPAVEGGRYTYLRMSNITDGGKLDLSETKKIDVDDEEFEKCCVRSGDLMFNRTNSGDKVGKTCVFDNENPMIIAGYIIRVRFNSEVTSTYISAVFNSPYGKNWMRRLAKNSVCQSNINSQQLKSIEVPVPPMALQIQYEEFLKQVDKSRIIFEQQVAQYDELIKSRFIELFGVPTTNEKGWPTRTMKEVAPSKQPDLEAKPEGNWLLNLDAIQSNSGEIMFKNRVTSDELEGSIMTFSKDHVLYSKLRPYLNKVVIPDEPGYGTTELIPLLPDKNLLTQEYLAYILRSDVFVAKFSNAVAGTKMPRVSMDTFWKFSVPLPPLDLQEDFGDFVKQVDKSRFLLLSHLKNLAVN